MLGKFVKVKVAGKYEFALVVDVGANTDTVDVVFLKPTLKCVTHGVGEGQYLAIDEEAPLDPQGPDQADKPEEQMITTGEGQHAVGTTEKEPEPHDGEEEGKKEKEEA